MGEPAAVDGREQRADEHERQKIRVNADRRNPQNREPGSPAARFAAGSKRGAGFKPGKERKQEQPLRGERRVAERALPQGGQAGKERPAEQTAKRDFRPCFAAAGGQQTAGRPLQRKAAEGVPPEPLEGGGQRAAQQLERDADPGQAVGIRNCGAAGPCDGIGVPQRESPVAVAEEQPARIMLLDIPFIVAV